MLRTILKCDCLGIRDQVPLASKALNSSDIDWCRSKCFKASVRQEGSMGSDSRNFGGHTYLFEFGDAIFGTSYHGVGRVRPSLIVFFEGVL